jgi:ATP-dependent helicase/nuclease subunit B
MITHLAATRWRKFDAVLLLGCDARLPSADKAVWFNDAVRDTGLPVRRVPRAARGDLLSPLALNDTVLPPRASKGGDQSAQSYLKYCAACISWPA